MSAGIQSVLFEPHGAELARLAASHGKTAQALRCTAENLAVRGFLASSRSFELLAEESDRLAMVCEMACQLEHLSGAEEGAHG